MPDKRLYKTVLKSIICILVNSEFSFMLVSSYFEFDCPGDFGIDQSSGF